MQNINQAKFNPYEGFTRDDYTNVFGLCDVFAYTTQNLSLDAYLTTPGQGTTVSFSIQNDSGFLWTHAIATATEGGVGSQLPYKVTNALLTIQDTSSGNMLMNSALPLFPVFGTPTQPVALPQPYFFAANTTVVVSLFNTEDMAAAYDFELTFQGIKMFEFRGK